MKTPRWIPLLLAVVSVGFAAQSASSYQVTGPIVALTDKVITVQKGDEKWEIARTAETKTEGKLAVGERVTVYYTMSAERIESRPASGKATDKSTRGTTKSTDKTDKKSSR